MIRNNKNTNVENKDVLEKAIVFIDGSNLYHSLSENCKRFDVNYEALAQKLTEGKQLFRIYYYNIMRDSDKNQQAYHDQQKFLSALYSTPYLEVKLGISKQRGETSVEKGVDIMLATDLLKLGWEDSYDVAILVSGDGDFAYAVKTVKDLGKHVEVAAFESNLSWELANIADKRHFFDVGYFSKLWNNKPAAKTPSTTKPKRSRWSLGIKKPVKKTVSAEKK